MRDRRFIGWADGWLCVCWQSTQSNSAETVTVYWPVAECAEALAAPLLGAECVKESGPADPNGRYLALLPDGAGWEGPAGKAADRIGLWFSPESGNGRWYVRLRLTDGGATKSIRSDIEPLPCPRVRKGMETRYRNGRWEKYLKASGWVAA